MGGHGESGDGGGGGGGVEAKEYSQAGFDRTKRFLSSVISIVDAPATFFREKIIEPNRAKNQYFYYHRKFPRVPTIDQCEINDTVCFHEANEQFLRDKMVDKQITILLQDKLKDCAFQHGQYDATFKCAELLADYDTALTNYHIKYGDLTGHAHVVDVYMKQKHRLIWQRRNPGKDNIGLEKRKESISEIQDNARKVFSNERL